MNTLFCVFSTFARGQDYRKLKVVYLYIKCNNSFPYDFGHRKISHLMPLFYFLSFGKICVFFKLY